MGSGLLRPGPNHMVRYAVQGHPVVWCDPLLGGQDTYR